MSQWQGYIIAAIIGLLIGTERERHVPKQKVMGVRTFLFIALLGALAGDLEISWLSALIAAFTLGLIVIGYMSQTNADGAEADRGLTTEFAGGIVFCLSYAAHKSPALAATIGPIVALLLFSKKTLHRFIQTIRQSELQAALLLLLGAAVVVNIAPDEIVDPWGIFNPRKFGMLVMILATLEFFSYVITKIFGQKKGALFVGLFGGLVSSTAVLLSAAKSAKTNPASWRTQVSLALTAKLAAFVEVLFIVALVAPSLLLTIWWSVGAGLLLGLVELYFVYRKSDVPHSGLSLTSPLDWKGVIRLAVLLASILFGISVAKQWLGESASLIVSFLTGLFELHGVSLANATLFSQGQLSAKSACTSILFAAMASMVAKIVLAWLIAKGPFARGITVAFLPIIATLGVMVWLFLSVN